MSFLFITITRYLLTALAALFLSIVISFLTISLFVSADENPVVGGLFRLFAVLAEGELIVPLSRAIAAELIERKVQARRFSWPKARGRILAAIRKLFVKVAAVDLMGRRLSLFPNFPKNLEILGCHGFGTTIHDDPLLQKLVGAHPHRSLQFPVERLGSPLA
jgi:hypothetical protein